MAFGIELRADPVRSLAAASIVAGYTAIGSSLANAGRIYTIQNLTDVTVMFSYDGVNDHFPLPSNGFRTLDVTTNQAQTQGFYVSVGTTFYVKRIGTPSTGSVYVSVEYAATK